MSDSNVSFFTRIRIQRLQVNNLGIVLSETITMISLSATPTVGRWADISHITSQTMLGISRLGYSCWRLVVCYVCEVPQYRMCHQYYVTAERRWRLEWVGVRYHAWMHISQVHCSPAQTAFTETVTRTHIGQHGTRHWKNNADRL